jgi:hypothetical protein
LVLARKGTDEVSTGEKRRLGDDPGGCTHLVIHGVIMRSKAVDANV